jgi:uncharacterized membrane protein YczE
MKTSQTLISYAWKLLKRVPIIMLGFFIVGIGIQIMILTDLGLNPWGIFHSGLSRLTGLTFGQAAQLTGLAIIVISTFLKIYPGIGTILNMYFIGFFIDFIAKLDFLPRFNGLGLNIVYFLIGNFIFAFGVYFYLYANLGSGPRDSLMIAFAKLSRFTAGQVKISMDIIAAIAGYLMGGIVGIGTVLAATTAGLFIDLIFKFFKYDPKTRTLTNLVINYKEVKEILSKEIKQEESQS